MSVKLSIICAERWFQFQCVTFNVPRKANRCVIYSVKVEYPDSTNLQKWPDNFNFRRLGAAATRQFTDFG
jgi:hypothetical protein